MYVHRSSIYSFLCFLRTFFGIFPSFSELFFSRVHAKRTYFILLLPLLLLLFSLSLSSSLSLFSVHLGRALNRIKDKASAVATTRHDNGEQWDGIWSVSYSNLFATKGHSLRWRSRTERKHFDRPPRSFVLRCRLIEKFKQIGRILLWKVSAIRKRTKQWNAL